MSTSMLDTRPIQMNVRIDRQLKEAGDAVLAHIGMTPSQAVRALWEYLVINERMPSKEGSAEILSDEANQRFVESRAARVAISFAIRASNTASPSLSSRVTTMTSMRRQWPIAIPSGWSYECGRNPQVAHRYQCMDGLFFWQV